MSKKKIGEKINKLLDENNKVGERNAIIQISMVAVFIGSSLLLSFFVSTKAQVDLSIAMIILISIIVSAIALVLSFVFDDTKEEGGMLQYAKYINEQWVHDNTIDNEFYKTIRPNEKDVAKKAMLFLYDNFGIELVK